MILYVASLLGVSLMSGHAPVLAEEALELLQPQDGGLYLDATFGGGGHTAKLLESAHTRVVALDRDPAAEHRAASLKSRYGDQFAFRHMNFSNLGQMEEGPFDGILFDFGVSSFQLDQLERGFSFKGSGPLDMRMNPHSGLSARDWLATASRDQLCQAIRDFGEEKNWRRIVNAIIDARGASQLSTTADLSDLILSCTPARMRFGSKIHPATKAFQGIRIAVNEELSAIEEGLPSAFEKLKLGGVLCVISFHSLEDRIAKRLFRKWAGRPEGAGDHRPQDMREVKAELLNRRPITASDREVADNPRSRSAKLRGLRKVA